MGDLKKWIEAQLKRGYKAKQIKQLLASKGYPQSAVAEVDKVIYSTSPRKKIPKKVPYKPITLISIVIGIALVAWLISAAPFFSKQQENINELGIAEIPSDDLCNGLQNIEGEITCEEAIELALQKFPGEAIEVYRDIMDFSDLKEVKAIYDLWITKIRLNTPIEHPDNTIKIVVIGIDVTDGRVKYTRVQ